MSAIANGIGLFNIRRGWLPERDLRGLYTAFDCSRPNTLWQNTGGTTIADAVGEPVARWDAANNSALRGVSATTRIPVLAAYGTGLGIAFDSSDDRLEFQATMAAMLANRSAFSMAWAIKVVDLASSFKRLCYVNNAVSTTRVNLVQTHNASGDIPNCTIRRVDGASSLQTNFPNLTAYEERVYGITYDATIGELKYYENGVLMTTADLTGTVGDGSFSNTNSTEVFLGESSGATYFAWYTSVNVVWTAGEMMQLADTLAARSGQ